LPRRIRDSISEMVDKSNKKYADRSDEYLRALRHRLRKKKAAICSRNGCHAPSEDTDMCKFHQLEINEDMKLRARAKKALKTSP
jgi:hypothetical protein